MMFTPQNGKTFYHVVTVLTKTSSKGCEFLVLILPPDKKWLTLPPDETHKIDSLVFFAEVVHSVQEGSNEAVLEVRWCIPMDDVHKTS